MPSHKQMANWYTQLGQHLDAGVLMADALMLCGGPPAKDREAMAARIQDGDTIESVLRDAPKWLPKKDRYFLVAAAETGNLPQTLQNLSDHHSRIGATQMKVILGLAYPLGVFHLAALLLPVIRMIDYEEGFQWDAAAYLIQLALLLVPVWSIIGLIYYLARSDHPLLPRILRCLPLLKKYSKMQAMADLSYSLGTFITAGLPVPSAWRLSAKIINDPELKNVAKELEPTFARGEDPSGRLHQFKCLPPEFKAFYNTGAESGQLDSNLIRAGKQFQEKANLSMTMAAVTYPTLMLVAVAGFIVITIFKVYGSYLNVFETLAQ